MARISVILPCYNVEKYIDRCLTSIERQTFGLDNLEVICVDDCSTDSTIDILKEWESRYPDNFLIIESPQNGRQGQARNIGLSYASTDWIGFIDSDDWIEPDYFEKLYNIAAAGEYDVVCCQNVRDPAKELSYILNRETTGTGIVVQIDSQEDRNNLIINPILEYNAWGKLISKAILVDNNIYFPENLAYEDVFWGSLLMLYVKKAFILKDVLYHYFVNEDSTVLKGNAEYHYDLITVSTMLWDEWINRGFMEEYREELEMEHIYSAFLAGMKMLILRFEKPNYNGYLLLRYLILSRIPDYENNKYIKRGILPEKYSLTMLALKNQLSRSQFAEVAENLKLLGI